VENSEPDVLTAELIDNTMVRLTGLAAGEALLTLSTGDETEPLSSAFTTTVTEELESDWMFVDIGMPFQEGYPSKLGAQSYSIATYGANISGTSDEFSLLYKEKSGAQEIVTRIASIEERGSASSAGIMFRESEDPGSLYLMYTLTAYDGIQLRYRWDNDSPPVVETSDPGIEAPCWLKLSRNEYNYFSASYSEDGENWIPHGEFSIPLDLPPVAMVGMAATSGFNEGTSVFEEVGFGLPTGMAAPGEAPSFRVEHYPNPFTESTVLHIRVSEQTPVQIELYPISGKKIMDVLNGTVLPGGYQVQLNAGTLESGTYFYRVVTPGGVITNKLIKLKR
jgi:hypothetical protein